MRGDHDAEALALDPLAEGLERHQLVALLREALDQAAEGRAVGGRVALAEITPEPLGAVGEGLDGQPLHQLLDRRERKRAGMEPAAERQRQLLDRIAERVVFGLGAARRDLLAQLASSASGSSGSLVSKQVRLVRQQRQRPDASAARSHRRAARPGSSAACRCLILVAMALPRPGGPAAELRSSPGRHEAVFLAVQQKRR